MVPLSRAAADIPAHTRVPGAANCRTRHSSGLAIASTTSSSGLSGRLAASLNDVSARCGAVSAGTYSPILRRYSWRHCHIRRRIPMAARSLLQHIVHRCALYGRIHSISSRLYPRSDKGREGLTKLWPIVVMTRRPRVWLAGSWRGAHRATSSAAAPLH